MRKLLYFLLTLSIIGILVTAYLLYIHFTPEASSFCTFGKTFSCDIVNKSVYAEILKIPVALLGLLTYMFFFLTLISIKKKRNFQYIHRSLLTKNVIKILISIALIGTAFSLYLTYREAVTLQTFCILCLIHQVDIIILTIGFIYLYFAHEKQETSHRL